MLPAPRKSVAELLGEIETESAQQVSLNNLSINSVNWERVGLAPKLNSVWKYVESYTDATQAYIRDACQLIPQDLLVYQG